MLHSTFQEGLRVSEPESIRFLFFPPGKVGPHEIGYPRFGSVKQFKTMVGEQTA
jgi:hypothetical protein